MTFVKSHPRNVNFFNQFDSIFNELFKENVKPKNHVSRTPAFNLIELAKGYRLELAVPGLTKEDIQLNVDKDILTIGAEKKYEKKEGEKVLRRSFGNYKFEKTFHLPETVDADQINATFENGVLIIALAKKEAAVDKPARTIEIA